MEGEQVLEAKGTPRYVGHAREWIEACNKLHGDACLSAPISQRPPDDVPLWLIDTHQRCIVPGLSAHRYLALSYVWPETRGTSDPVSAPPRSLLLDSESRAALQTPGFLGSEGMAQQIPLVIRHAMLFTAALGERYLWVDRLCIVQNDTGDGGTLSQVRKMDKIYAGAYVTIIAAAPDEMYEEGLAREWPSFGTPRTKRRRRRRRRKLFLGVDEEESSDEEASQKPSKRRDLSQSQIVQVMSARYFSLSRSKWATRGWTYQEQILCKRALIFIEKGFFWDCHCCIWDGVDLLPGQYFDGIPQRAEMGQRFSTRWWPDFSFYLDLICPYNGREFSYPQDAMLGICGVLSALEKSFPGGFIHGLPRLFLDHALLWQPFGTAQRRVDRAEDKTIRSSLPSWSWCGWQVFVDPWSLRSGLEYIHEARPRRRAASWRTRNLVEWHFSIGDRTPEPVLEPRMLAQHIDKSPAVGTKISDGWDALEVSSSEFNALFTHANDRSTYFKHPLPLNMDLSVRSLLNTPGYLTFSTTTASLFPATVLDSSESKTWIELGPSKISVFEDETFKRGPSRGKTCPILVLQQPNGAFAGLLRLMTNDQIDKASVIELVAISTGSARAPDFRKSFEWKIFETGRDEYEDSGWGQMFIYCPKWLSDTGKYALLFDIATAFDKEAARNEPVGQELENVLAEVEQRTNQHIMEAAARHPSLFTSKGFRVRTWFQERTSFLQTQAEQARRRENLEFNPEAHPYLTYSHWNWLNQKNNRDGFPGASSQDSSGHHSPEPLNPPRPGVLVCEFYNVLWIERREGIAYRRACGWVPKYIWEAHATGPVEVRLG